MTAAGASFEDLLCRARSGDAAALDTLARTYEADVRIAARVHLGPALRPYLDSIDLVQSVHRSLMRGLRDNRFELASPANLIALTLTMVRRKVARQWRKHRRQQRLDGADGETPAAVLASLSSQNVDPVQALVVRDAMVCFCRDLDATDRTLLEMRLQGFTTTEVARHLGVTSEALRIRLFRLRQHLKERSIANDWL